MSSSMMRTTPELSEDIKILKGVYGSGSNSEIVQRLVSEELKNYKVKTQDGYLGEGSVVLGISKKPVVICSVSKYRVTFSDNTSIVNGSRTCEDLKLLADTVEEFDGVFPSE